MKKACLVALILLSGCAYHDDYAMQRAVDICNRPLAPGEVEDFAQTEYCIRQNYHQIAESRRQQALQSLAASSQSTQNAVNAMMPHYARCSTINGVTSCMGR